MYRYFIVYVLVSIYFYFIQSFTVFLSVFFWYVHTTNVNTVCINYTVKVFKAPFIYFFYNTSSNNKITLYTVILTITKPMLYSFGYSVGLTTGEGKSFVQK